MTSCVYVGTVRHRRRQPRVHEFRYRMVMAYLDLDELSEVERAVRPFSVNRPNLWSFYDRDHIDGRDGSTADKLRRFLAAEGFALDGGTIGVLTQCRTFGYVFNPISLFYCRDRGGRLVTVVAEVQNTFGERHLYPLDVAKGPPDGVMRARTPKRMHVSPFLAMAADYAFRLAPLGDRLSVGIVEHERDAPVLVAHLWGERRPMTTGVVARVLARYPLTTLGTIAGIHAEAARLWLKGVPVVPRPGPTAEQQAQTSRREALAGARTSRR